MVKTIGLIGGMSWESSIEYYRIINETVRDRLGGLHSAKSVVVSVDFAEIETLAHSGRWVDVTRLLVAAARMVRHLGSARRRGRGECRLELIEAEGFPQPADNESWTHRALAELRPVGLRPIKQPQELRRS